MTPIYIITWIQIDDIHVIIWVRIVKTIRIIITHKKQHTKVTKMTMITIIIPSNKYYPYNDIADHLPLLSDYGEPI